MLDGTNTKKRFRLDPQPVTIKIYKNYNMHVFEPRIYHLVMFGSMETKIVGVEERWPGAENEQGNIGNEKKMKSINIQQQQQKIKVILVERWPIFNVEIQAEHQQRL